MAGAAGGELFCGCRRSALGGNPATEHGGCSRWGVWGPSAALSALAGSYASGDGCGRDGTMAGGEGFSGKVVGLARVRKQKKDEKGEMR